MKEAIQRRRFVAVVGTAGIAGVAGCVGDDEPADEHDGGSGSESGSGDDEDEQGAEAEAEQDGDGFDFPPGADENGVVIETVLSGAREALDRAGRYRIEQRHGFAYPSARDEAMEITYDVDGETIHETERRSDEEIDRWVTPERTICRSVAVDDDRSGLWRTDTAVDPEQRFGRYPFEETAVPALLESTAFEFDEIVVEDPENDDDAERSYARYSGDVASPGGTLLRSWDSARVAHRFESAPEGRVSMLLSESGAIHAVEYELAGQVARSTHDGYDVIDAEASGSVAFEYDDLEALNAPEWAEASADEHRSFAVEERSQNHAYELVQGPSLPGASEYEHAEFYVRTSVGDDVYVDRHTQQQSFDVGDRLFAGIDDGELVADWKPVSGRDPFVEADRIEMTVYLYAPGEGRTPVFHETYYTSGHE